MQEIYQSATGISVLIGPFLDVTDGKTPETGIDLTTADYAVIVKHGCSASLALTSATWTDMTSGWYALNATSTMFDTVGMATIRIHDISVCLPVWKDIMIVPTAHWQFKYGTTRLTVASCSNPVIIYGTSAGAISASSFAAGALATAAQIASYTWAATASTHAITNSYGLTLGGVPSTTTLASTVMAIVGKTGYLPSASIASTIWNALSADYSVAGSFGELLGDLAAGADPWSSTVTAYTTTNTFGLLLGGLPSTTTLASTIAAIVGKTAYLSSATVGDWTISSVTGSVHALATNIWNKATYLPSSTVGDYTIASVTGSVRALGSSIWGNVDYLPSQTVGDWALTASVSGSVYSMASSIWGKASYIPSATVENWTIASVSNSVHIGITDVGTITGAITGVISSVSICGRVASVSADAVIATNVAAIYGKLPTKYYLTGTNELDGDLEMASVIGVFPNDLTGTLASVSSSVLVRPMVASLVWAALSSSFGAAGTFGGILGGMGASADPWSSTVTAYLTTNTFGLLLGGLASTTTLASTLMAVHGKAVYIPSATVETWTIASVSNSVHIGVTDVGTVSGNVIGTVASVSSSVLIRAGQTVASVSNYSGWTIASISGTALVMLTAIQGKTSYIPSATVENWTIASVSNSVHIGMTDIGTVTGNLLGTAASVSSSVLIRAGQTVASVSNYSGWTIASVSGTAMTGLVAIQGKTDYLPSLTVGSWAISGVASVSVVGIVSSVSASVVDGIFEEVIEGTTTLRQSQMYQNAFAAGKAVVAAGSATVSFRDIADSTNRLIMDVDEDGNRTTVTRVGI